MCCNCILVLFLPLYLNLYTDIQSKPPFTKVLLTKTAETNDASGIVSISFKAWELFCGLAHQARIISRISPSFFQQFLESFHYFAFLRTDGAGTSPPSCSKLLAQYVCCRAVTDTLPPCFTEKRNGWEEFDHCSCRWCFFFFFCFLDNLLVSLKWDKVDDTVSHFLTVFVEIWFLVQ